MNKRVRTNSVRMNEKVQAELNLDK